MSASLKSQPWKTAEPRPEILAPKGMVGPEERTCYHWLGRHFLSGQGHIVDAGSFLGAATYCFASGAAEAGRRQQDGGPLIHSYDFFKVVDEYVGEAIQQDFRPIEQGESYLDIFEAQTEGFGDMISTHPGDFLGHR